MGARQSNQQPERTNLQSQPTFSQLRPAQVSLWMLQNSQPGQVDPATLTVASQELLRRSDADALSLAMASWALATAAIFDQTYFCTAGVRLVGAIQQLEGFPRGPEALANTAKAFARFAVATGKEEMNAVKAAIPTGLFEAIASVAGKRKRDFSLAEWIQLSQAYAVTGLAILPFGADVPGPVAKLVHAKLNELDFVGSTIYQDPGGFSVHSIPNFISEAETASLLEIASPLWKPSRTYVGEPALRTSDTASLRGSGVQDAPIVLEIMKRATALVGLSLDHCETLQLVRYESDSQYYKDHFDLLDDETQLLLGGQRVATVLVYLTTIPDGLGGETSFPNVPVDGGLKVRPTAGTAVLWANVDTSGSQELLSRHAALPLNSQEDGDVPVVKYAVNCWIRSFPGASSL